MFEVEQSCGFGGVFFVLLNIGFPMLSYNFLYCVFPDYTIQLLSLCDL